LDLRRRQIKELIEPGQVNVKYSAGGLIDIEYAVQYLQIIHGHRRPALRQVNTLHALAALAQEDLISPQEAERLEKAYSFIRKLIDGLRMVRGHAKDLVLPETYSDDFVFLARRLGYTTEDWQAGAKRLQSDIEQHMTGTRKFFERKFGRL
jgi:glutamate-ammonia-ligase adenylyltransferase